jgi:hypothetical protein
MHIRLTLLNESIEKNVNIYKLIIKNKYINYKKSKHIYKIICIYIHIYNLYKILYNISNQSINRNTNE